MKYGIWNDTRSLKKRKELRIMSFSQSRYSCRDIFGYLQVLKDPCFFIFGMLCHIRDNLKKIAIHKKKVAISIIL